MRGARKPGRADGRLIERLEEYAGLTSLDKIIETGLVATVLGDRIFAGLRHLAQEQVSRSVLGG